MQELVKKYGVIIILYLVIIGGVLLLNERFRLLNNGETLIEEVSKWFTNMIFFAILIYSKRWLD